MVRCTMTAATSTSQEKRFINAASGKESNTQTKRSLRKAREPAAGLLFNENIPFTTTSKSEDSITRFEAGRGLPKVYKIISAKKIVTVFQNAIGTTMLLHLLTTTFSQSLLIIVK